MREGKTEAANDLVPLVYEQLRAVARRRVPRGPGRTLNTTTLVHEAYLKLFDRSQLSWNDRHHFFAVAATAMRQVVVDQARRRQAQKRGGKSLPAALDPTALAVDDQAEEILALNEALLRLSKLDERLARIVELRFFGGLSVAEVAEALDTSERTVKRDWRKARALLHEVLFPKGLE
jgi:RNA polymerase sigma factor (TIGR02999 family)